ncbi:site-specific integrase [Haloechinothrix salitolerans]
MRGRGEGSIYPYRNGYAAYVWVETPNGRRKRKYVYGKTEDIVREKWLELHQQARKGPVATNTPTLAEYLEYWLSEVIEPNRAPLTYSTYEIFVRLYIGPGLGKKRLHRLRQRDVQIWINQVARTCQCCAQGKDLARPEGRRRCCAAGECCEDRLSARSLSDIRACLRSALSSAIDDELISKNVAKHVKLPRVRKSKRNHWTTDEARRFLESARNDGDPFYAAYVLVLVLGMRKGEVLGVPVDAIDLDGLELDIHYQLQRVGGRLLHRETKSEASDDPLPLPNIATTALKLRLEDRAEDRTKADLAWQEFGLLFTTRYGTPIEPRNFNRSWNARCRKAGVRKITVHDARRTCGSLLADLDVHPRVAMRVLRHAQVSVTMEVYTEVSSEQTREALKRLGDSLA